jgi:hypothetical protein
MWGHTLLHLEDVQGPGGPFSQGGISSIPDVFTPWREKVGGNWPDYRVATIAVVCST